MNEHQRVQAWLESERAYSYSKFGGKPADDAKPLDWWVQQLENYIGRVETLGVEHEAGVQAVLKLAATAVAFAESVTRKWNHLPEAGVPSGELRPQ